MSEGAYIRDVRSLEELNNMISFTGEVMANIEENVSNYIDRVKEVLEKQLDVILEKLKEAEEKLSEAQDDLSSCEASQRYDEESGEYHPSCSSEARAVDAARREVDEWRQKYDEGKRIVDECQSEIRDYNSPGGGLFSPPGGHYLICGMCETQTPYATQQLKEHIEDVYDYRQSDVGGNENNVEGNSNPSVKEEDTPMTEEERFAIFKQNIQGIKDEQQMESYSRNIKDANRVMRCPNCGRPLQLCTCKNLHVEVDLYQ